MLRAAFNSPLADLLRRITWAATDRVAFVVESFCIANAVFWFLTFAALSFSWQSAAHEWGSFWTHYAAATAASRFPVERFVGVTLLILTLGTAAIRFPKARISWSAFPGLRSPGAAGHHRKDILA